MSLDKLREYVRCSLYLSYFGKNRAVRKVGGLRWISGFCQPRHFNVDRGRIETSGKKEFKNGKS